MRRDPNRPKSIQRLKQKTGRIGRSPDDCRGGTQTGRKVYSARSRKRAGLGGVLMTVEEGPKPAEKYTAFEAPPETRRKEEYICGKN